MNNWKQVLSVMIGIILVFGIVAMYDPSAKDDEITGAFSWSDLFGGEEPTTVKDTVQVKERNSNGREDFVKPNNNSESEDGTRRSRDALVRKKAADPGHLDVAEEVGPNSLDLYISNKILHPGDILKFTIKGDSGYEPNASIWYFGNATHNTHKISEVSLCAGENYCTGDSVNEFEIPADWDFGEYMVLIFKDDGEWVRSVFWYESEPIVDYSVNITNSPIYNNGGDFEIEISVDAGTYYLGNEGELDSIYYGLGKDFDFCETGDYCKTSNIKLSLPKNSQAGNYTVKIKFYTKEKVENLNYDWYDYKFLEWSYHPVHLIKNCAEGDPALSFGNGMTRGLKYPYGDLREPFCLSEIIEVNELEVILDVPGETGRLEGIEEFGWFSYLYVSGVREQDLDRLSQIKASDLELKNIIMDNNLDLSFLSNASVKYLNLEGRHDNYYSNGEYHLGSNWASIKSLEGLSGLELRSLEISYLNVTNLDVIQEMDDLSVLKINNGGAEEKLKTLPLSLGAPNVFGEPSLKYVELTNTEVEDFSLVKDVYSLKIKHNKEFNNLTSLIGGKVKKLWIQDTNVSDLSPLLDAFVPQTYMNSFELTLKDNIVDISYCTVLPYLVNQNNVKVDVRGDNAEEFEELCGYDPATLN
jgi:hypothetical protein